MADEKIKEPVDPQQAPNTGASPVMSEEVAEHHKELAEDAAEAASHRDKKSQLVAERELKDLEEHTPKKDVDRIRDVAEKESDRRDEQEEARKLQEERKDEMARPRVAEGEVDSGDLEVVLEPYDEDQRRLTINVHVFGELDDGYITIYEKDPIFDDAKKGRVYQSTRFGTKNRIRTGFDKKGNPTGKAEETLLGHFQTTPIRLHPGEYRGVVETVGGKTLERFSFELLGDAVDGQGTPIDHSDPMVHSKELAAQAEKRIAKEEDALARARERAVRKVAPKEERRTRRTRASGKRQGAKSG